ncbi:MAG: hypothetical protein U0031_16620 [Thermomicrobiales bacterium]
MPTSKMDRLKGTAVIVGLSLAVTACGPGAAPPAAETGTQARPGASPNAQQVPDLTNQTNATLANGSLTPDRFAGRIGDAYRLVVSGDGAEHTLAIEGLVAAMTIAAQGDTPVEFTIVGDPGISQITVDGKPAGEFERRSASGATS